jgi:hypothetical protein
MSLILSFESVFLEDCVIVDVHEESGRLEFRPPPFLHQTAADLRGDHHFYRRNCLLPSLFCKTLHYVGVYIFSFCSFILRPFLPKHKDIFIEMAHPFLHIMSAICDPLWKAAM